MAGEQACKTVILGTFSSDSKITVGTNEAAAFWLKILLGSHCLGFVICALSPSLWCLCSGLGHAYLLHKALLLSCALIHPQHQMVLRGRRWQVWLPPGR